MYVCTLKRELYFHNSNSRPNFHFHVNRMAFYIDISMFYDSNQDNETIFM